MPMYNCTSLVSRIEKGMQEGETVPKTEVKVEEEEDMDDDEDMDTGEGEGEIPLNSIDVNMIKTEDNTYECRICKNIYSSKINLKRHYKNVHEFSRVKCTVCNIEMTRKSYQRHLKRIHGFNQPKVSSNDENEDTHAVADAKPAESGGEQEGNINPCEVLCKVEMNEPPHDGERNVNFCFQGVECKLCSQTYSNELNLKKHVYNVHRMVRVKCHVCDKEVNKKSLDRHMKSVHSAKVSVKKDKKSIPDEEKIPCILCGKRCINLMSLQNHIKNIHEAEQFKCKQCDFQGIQKHLERHMKKFHNEQIYQCPRCQKVLKSKSTLKEHMWIHTDHRRFICDICGMRFKRTSNYHGHMKSHQEKKFQCQLCGNFFLRKRYLAVHEQTIHNFYGEGVPPQEKGYQCEVCGVKLKWKNNLLAHMRIHTGEKPYKCKLCGDDFTCHGSLRTHMSKHAICQASSEVSSMFIQQAYLDNRPPPPAHHSLPTTPFSSQSSSSAV